jgi:hypothetical protein
MNETSSWSGIGHTLSSENSLSDDGGVGDMLPPSSPDGHGAAAPVIVLTGRVFWITL